MRNIVAEHLEVGALPRLGQTWGGITNAWETEHIERQGKEKLKIVNTTQ